ncbi:MAG TPA: hypothetical protein VF741_02910 [Candidatus Aquilonibacter sp.]
MLRTAALVVFASALLAAVTSHVGIDVLGDFLVRDDTYDHLAHGSRVLFTLTALGLGATAGLYLFSHLCAAAASLRLRVRMLRIRRTHAAGLIACVIALALLLVPLMETIDVLRAGGDVDSLSDAFGSSLLLGISTTTACALLWSGAVLGLAAWLVHRCDRIVTLLATLLQLRRARGACVHPRRAAAAIVASASARRSRHHSKRGPPFTAAFVLAS